jgi:hypothetical protein
MAMLPNHFQISKCLKTVLQFFKYIFDNIEKEQQNISFSIKKGID